MNELETEFDEGDIVTHKNFDLRATVVEAVPDVLSDYDGGHVRLSRPEWPRHRIALMDNVESVDGPVVEAVEVEICAPQGRPEEI